MYFFIKLKHSWNFCCKPPNFKLSMSQSQSAEIFKGFFHSGAGFIDTKQAVSFFI